jgi:hypothetical protein
LPLHFDVVSLVIRPLERCGFPRLGVDGNLREGEVVEGPVSDDLELAQCAVGRAKQENCTGSKNADRIDAPDPLLHQTPSADKSGVFVRGTMRLATVGVIPQEIIEQILEATWIQ